MPYSKTKSKTSDAYDRLRADIKSGRLGCCYIFYGEEKYLLQNSLNKIRDLLCPGGLDSFNYKRFDAGNISAQALEDTIEILPFTADRTLIEVHEYNLFKGGEGDASDDREQIHAIMSDLPEHVCLIFVYSSTEFKPENRLKAVKEVLSHAEVIEFQEQEDGRLSEWVIAHFSSLGKQISRSDALYLINLTDGLMVSLHSEIAKIASYAREQRVSRDDIDAVVIPVLDAVSYLLTDAIVKRNHKTALQLLDKLIQMREPAHKLFFSISLKMRQLLAARIFVDCKGDKKQFMSLCGINKEYPADILLSAARKTTRDYCLRAVSLCSDAAKELNRTAEGLNSAAQQEACIIELTARLVKLQY